MCRSPSFDGALGFLCALSMTKSAAAVALFLNFSMKSLRSVMAISAEATCGTSASRAIAVKTRIRTAVVIALRQVRMQYTPLEIRRGLQGTANCQRLYAYSEALRKRYFG